MWHLKQIEGEAIKFLGEYNPDLEIPVPIEEILEFKLGIRIVVYEGMESRFAVNGLINNRFDSIGIDQWVYEKQPERARFTLAEEVGHMVLHREWYSKHGPGSFTKFLEWHSGLDLQEYDYIERQAKTFAAFVLIPTGLLNPAWKEFVRSSAGVKALRLDQIPDNFPGFCQKFGVTAFSMLLRLERAGLLFMTDVEKDKVFNRK